MTTQSTYKIIEPLVRRHAEDAAFYWAQHDASSESPHLGLLALTRLSQLLDANLEGLRVAGPAGLQLSIAALETWKKAPEAFVAIHTALSQEETVELGEVWAQVRARPDELMRGVISALAWLSPAHARDVINQWTASGDSCMQVAALRAVALHGGRALGAVAHPLQDFLQNPNEHVRAAACRVASLGHHRELSGALAERLEDSASQVRAEAAIALGHVTRFTDVEEQGVAALHVRVLYECAIAQVAVLNSATGWYRKTAMRRLIRWVRHLAAQCPVEQDCTDFLRLLPDEPRMQFIAYHGSPRYLTFALEQMHTSGCGKLAGWAWQIVTGVDLVAAGLSLPDEAVDPEAEGISEVPLNDYIGLTQPDADAVKRYPTAHLRVGKRYLTGLPVQPEHLIGVLRTATQAVRHIAAYHLEYLSSDARIGIRAAVPRQHAAIERLEKLRELRGTDERVA